MTTLLSKLADNWHIPHPYRNYILSIVPSTNYAAEIEDSLIAIYVAEHYDFKIYKSPSHHTVYDNDIDSWKHTKGALEKDIEKDEKTLEKLNEKFIKLQSTLDPSSCVELQKEEEEEEEEEAEIILAKGQGKERIQTQKNTKQTAQSKKEEMKRLLKEFEATKSNMASLQDKLMTMQKEIEGLDKKIRYYGHYQYASKGFSNTIKRLVLSYEKTRDLAALVKELDDLHTYYDMIRRRYVPSGRCEGTKGLCETHLLPLSPSLYSDTGMILSARCALHPV